MAEVKGSIDNSIRPASLEEKRAYDSGYSAYCDGKKEEDCPHRDGANLTMWLAGFHDAEDEKQQPVLL